MTTFKRLFSSVGSNMILEIALLRENLVTTFNRTFEVLTLLRIIGFYLFVEFVGLELYFVLTFVIKILFKGRKFDVRKGLKGRADVRVVGTALR